MLTARHLALLRAALQYFEEEFGPHGIEAMAESLEEPFRDELSARELRPLRGWLSECELRYALCDLAGERWLSGHLFREPPTLDQAINAKHGRIVTVLVGPSRD
ncbi:hypothetical protein SH661x_002874 [Planctomicrobium sp. SH661]|uniref:hypothetical protein n=1 Tax=Planctomicrobium sp. SH661 TaxID=3448124 RepID=UPI003F5B0407